jgi:hypothetical protein
LIEEPGFRYRDDDSTDKLVISLERQNLNDSKASEFDFKIDSKSFELLESFKAEINRCKLKVEISRFNASAIDNTKEFS